MNRDSRQLEVATQPNWIWTDLEAQLSEDTRTRLERKKTKLLEDLLENTVYKGSRYTLRKRRKSAYPDQYAYVEDTDFTDDTIQARFSSDDEPDDDEEQLDPDMDIGSGSAGDEMKSQGGHGNDEDNESNLKLDEESDNDVGGGYADDEMDSQEDGNDSMVVSDHDSSESEGSPSSVEAEGGESDEESERDWDMDLAASDKD